MRGLFEEAMLQFTAIDTQAAALLGAPLNPEETHDHLEGSGLAVRSRQVPKMSNSPTLTPSQYTSFRTVSLKDYDTLSTIHNSEKERTRERIEPFLAKWLIRHEKRHKSARNNGLSLDPVERIQCCQWPSQPGALQTMFCTQNAAEELVAVIQCHKNIVEKYKNLTEKLRQENIKLDRERSELRKQFDRGVIGDSLSPPSHMDETANRLAKNEVEIAALKAELVRRSNEVGANEGPAQTIHLELEATKARLRKAEEERERYAGEWRLARAEACESEKRLRDVLDTNIQAADQKTTTVAALSEKVAKLYIEIQRATAETSEATRRRDSIEAQLTTLKAALHEQNMKSKVENERLQKAILESESASKREAEFQKQENIKLRREQEKQQGIIAALQAEVVAKNQEAREYDGVHQKVTELTRLLTQSQIERSLFAAEVAELQKRAEDTVDRADLQAAEQVYAVRLDDLQKELEQAVTEVKTWEQKYERQAGNYETQLRVLRETIADAKMERARIKGDFDTANIKTSSLENELAQQRQIAEQLANELSNLQSENQDLARGLQEAKKQKEKDLNELRSRVDEQNCEIDNLKNRSASLDQRPQSLNQMHSNNEEKQGQAHANGIRQNAEIQRLQREKEEAILRLDENAALLEKAQKETRIQIDKYRNQEIELQKARKDLSDAETKNRNLAGSLAQERKAKADLEEQLEPLRLFVSDKVTNTETVDWRDAANKLRRLEHETYNLLHKLFSSETIAEGTSLGALLESVVAMAENLEKKLPSTNVTGSESEKLAEIRADLERTTQLLMETEKRENNLKSEMAELKRNLKNAEASSLELEQELRNARVALEERNLRVGQLEEAAKLLEEKVEMTEDSLQQSRTTIMNLQDQLNAEKTTDGRNPSYEKLKAENETYRKKFAILSERVKERKRQNSAVQENDEPKGRLAVSEERAAGTLKKKTNKNKKQSAEITQPPESTTSHLVPTIPVDFAAAATEAKDTFLGLFGAVGDQTPATTSTGIPTATESGFLASLWGPTKDNTATATVATAGTRTTFEAPASPQDGS